MQRWVWVSSHGVGLISDIGWLLPKALCCPCTSISCNGNILEEKKIKGITFRHHLTSICMFHKWSIASRWTLVYGSIRITTVFERTKAFLLNWLLWLWGTALCSFYGDKGLKGEQTLLNSMTFPLDTLLIALKQKYLGDACSSFSIFRLNGFRQTIIPRPKHIRKYGLENWLNGSDHLLLLQKAWVSCRVTQNSCYCSSRASDTLSWLGTRDTWHAHICACKQNTHTNNINTSLVFLKCFWTFMSEAAYCPCSFKEQWMRQVICLFLCWSVPNVFIFPQ